MQAKTRLEPATLQPHLPSHPLASPPYSRGPHFELTGVALSSRREAGQDSRTLHQRWLQAQIEKICSKRSRRSAPVGQGRPDTPFSALSRAQDPKLP